MPSDEDSEVILEGGELYNYFKSQGVDSCDVYSSKYPTFVTQTEIGLQHVLPKQVPKEVLDIVNAILNSKLLLEEDAIYLFQKSSELVPENKNIVTSKLVLSGIIIAICTYGFLRISNLNKFWISVMTCSSVVLLDGIKDILHLLNHTDNINKLLYNLQVTISYIRKHMKLIQEEDSLINSKEKILHLRNNENIINIYTIKRKRAEICIISKKVIVILKSLILLSRNTTLAIFKIEKKKSSISNISYIALYSDEQLGINRHCEELDEEANRLPLIDSLKNIYIMMQSETLRELSLCLFESAEALKISKLFNILHEYASQSSSILLELRNLYETHFYPSYAPEKINCVNNEIRCFSNILNSISSALNGLLIDSRTLQDYINENSDKSSSQTVGQKLLDMERDVAYLLEHMHASSQQLLKQTDYTQSDVPIITRNNDKIIKTGYTVGISDFSVTGHDEVFLGYVEGTENGINNSECVEVYDKPTYFNIFMGELKTALISKREDFEKREIKALKSNEDLESYKACNTEYDISAVSNSNLSNLESSSIVKQNISVSNPAILMLESTYSPFSKDVSTKAVNLFRTWNRKNNEECFGDESDGEGSEASLCNN